MTKLIPMTQDEYDQFMEISMESFSQDQITAGQWTAESAQENITKLRQKILPDNLQTKDHYFYSIKSEEKIVGGLWLMMDMEENQRFLFVTDIEIYPEHRRKGYATEAFLAMEEIVKRLGLDTIILHVFKHNHKAREMYKKLGYQGEDTKMVKKI